MASYGVVCPSEAGHLLSVGGLGAELVRRGHRVVLLSGPDAAQMAGELNLEFHEMTFGDPPDARSRAVRMVMGAVGAGPYLGQGNWFLWLAQVLLEQLPAALESLALDGLIVDEAELAAGTVAEYMGYPFVTVCSGLPWHEEAGIPPVYVNWQATPGRLARLRNRIAYAGLRWQFGPTLGVINRRRADWGLPRLRHIDETYSPLAQLAQLCRELDFPRKELPDVFHYVGPLTTNRRQPDHGFPWDRLDGRRLIYASVGTMADSRNLATIRKILAACADVDAQLVVGLGKWAGHRGVRGLDELGDIPGNPVLVDYAPQLAVLEKADLLITHAGINTVNEALSLGVPILALPRIGDQMGTAARIEAAGVGLMGSFNKSTPGEIRALVDRLLSEDRFRIRARALQQATAQSGEVRGAADIVEQALATGRPVYRQPRA